MPYKDPERKKQYDRDYHRNRYATDSEYRDKKLGVSRADWIAKEAARLAYNSKRRRRRLDGRA